MTYLQPYHKTSDSFMFKNALVHYTLFLPRGPSWRPNHRWYLFRHNYQSMMGILHSKLNFIKQITNFLWSNWRYLSFHISCLSIFLSPFLFENILTKSSLGIYFFQYGIITLAFTNFSTMSHISDLVIGKPLLLIVPNNINRCSPCSKTIKWLCGPSCLWCSLYRSLVLFILYFSAFVMSYPFLFLLMSLSCRHNYSFYNAVNLLFSYNASYSLL